MKIEGNPKLTWKSTPTPSMGKDRAKEDENYNKKLFPCLSVVRSGILSSKLDLKEHFYCLKVSIDFFFN